jgi:hypothetical protein
MVAGTRKGDLEARHVDESFIKAFIVCEIEAERDRRTPAAGASRSL